jgi:hypothetical protein
VELPILGRQDCRQELAQASQQRAPLPESALQRSCGPPLPLQLSQLGLQRFGPVDPAPQAANPLATADAVAQFKIRAGAAAKLGADETLATQRIAFGRRQLQAGQRAAETATARYRRPADRLVGDVGDRSRRMRSALAAAGRILNSFVQGRLIHFRHRSGLSAATVALANAKKSRKLAPAAFSPPADRAARARRASAAAAGAELKNCRQISPASTVFARSTGSPRSSPCSSSGSISSASKQRW